jgi:3-hydroxyacyl-[acyl-carrier-protein] dehydratase
MKGILLQDFFEIIGQEETENSLNTIIKLKVNHRIFDGHFPNRPIVPGVCILQIAKEILMQKTQRNLIMAGSNNIKFMNPIDPREHDTITVSINYSLQSDDIAGIVTVGHNSHIFCKFQAMYKMD